MQDDDDWIKLNAGQFGLYRVNYPVRLWNRLAVEASVVPPSNTAPVISAVDLAGLLDDAWAIAQTGETSIVHFLQLVRSVFPKELDGIECPAGFSSHRIVVGSELTG